MENNQKKDFWTDKKNIAITVLSVLVIIFAGMYTNEKNTTLPTSTTPALEDTASLNNQLAEANNTISTLEAQVGDLTQKNQELTTQVNSTGDLQKQLDEKSNYIFNLEEQVGVLTAEKSQLENQVNMLQQKSTSTSTSSSSTTSSTPSTSSSTSTSYTVYITNTGSKYHRSGCRYLKQSSHAIDKSDAISQGYSACSVCNP